MSEINNKKEKIPKKSIRILFNVIKLSKNKNLEFYLATGKALFLMKYFFSYE